MSRSGRANRTPEQKVGIKSVWQEKLRQIAKDGKIDRTAMARRLQSLRKDNVFARATDLVARALKRALAVNPECVSSFFRRFSSLGALRSSSAKHFLDSLAEGGVRKALQSYSRYALRFQVVIPFRKKSPHFGKVKVCLSFGPKFHGKVRRGQLIPVETGLPDEDVRPLYESESVEVSDPLQALIDVGFAKFIRVEDEDRTSVLTTLELIGFHPDGITMIVHEAEQPYLMCLFGENLTAKALQPMMKVVSAYQRKFFPGRGMSGRRHNIAREHKAFAELDKPGSLKEKADSVGKGNLASMVVYLARKKSMLKD